MRIARSSFVQVKKIGPIISQTFSKWSDHDAQTAAASLSYFTILSLAPLLVIAVSIAGIAFGHDAARDAILNQLGTLTGNTGADAIKGILTNAESPKSGIIASTVGFLVLIFSASGVFSQLRKSLNRIWEADPQASSGVWGFLKQQFFSYTMVIGIGFLLLVSLVISASLSAAGKFFGSIVPAAMLELVNSVVSLVVITVLFAIMYRVVPERTLPWRRLWVGSFATAALFTVGKLLLGLYLGHASVGSAYGAAGSLVVLLVWIYYSACLFLLGAEFTRQYAYEQQGVPIQKAGEEVEKTPEPEPTRIAVAPAAVKPMSAPGLSPSPAPQGSARKIVSDAPKTLKGLLVASAWVGAAVLFRRWYERPQH